MTNQQYKLKSLRKTQSIPIHWEFSQDDYENLIKGHRSNWCVFLRDDTVHFCRISGEEFYRFLVSKSADETYKTDSLEVYIPKDFYDSVMLNGWTDEKIKQYQMELRRFAIEETTGLLATYFGINKSI